jgi:hypothetical protein
MRCARRRKSCASRAPWGGTTPARRLLEALIMQHRRCVLALTLVALFFTAGSTARAQEEALDDQGIEATDEAAGPEPAVGDDGGTTEEREPTEGDPTRRPADGHRALGEGLWIAGLSVWAATYAFTGAGATALVYFANTRDATTIESWIPFVGPWIMLGDSEDFDRGQMAAVAISGVLQLAALASFIAGVVLVNEPVEGGASVAIGPMVEPAGGGLFASGAF